MSRFLLFAMIFLLGRSSLHATESAPITDPAQVRDHYQQVLTRSEFQETALPDINTRFKEWLNDWFKRLGNRIGELKYGQNMPTFATMLMTVLAGLSIAGLIYIMLRLTRRRARIEAGPSTGQPGQKNFRPPEDYDHEIELAVKSHDWHGAWLASWRQFLSRLENRQLVEADRTRTNREYLAQLRSESLPAPALALLTRMVDAYDRFIYGRLSIDEPDWNRFHHQISEAVLLLHLNDKGTGSRAKQDLA